MILRWIVIALFFILTFYVHGQYPISDSFEKAKQLVESEAYDEANKSFLGLLHPDSLMPNELCFFFGKSLYHTGYVEQGEQLFTKYLNLTDTSGVHYDSTMAYMRLINGVDYGKKVVEVANSNKGEVSHNHEFHEGEEACQGNEFIVCPVCNGSGVIVSEGTFGNYYQACPYSDTHGRMPCHNYIEYLNGNLIEVEK